jgi:hypothetical protein
VRVNSPHLAPFKEGDEGKFPSFAFFVHHLLIYHQQRAIFVRNNEQNAMHFQPSRCAHTITRKISKIRKKIATFPFWSEQIEKGISHRKEKTFEISSPPAPILT